MLKKVLPLAVLALFVGVAYLATEFKPQAKPQKEHPQPAISVETQTLQTEVFPVRISTFGIVQPRTQSAIVAQVSGQVMDVSPNLRDGGFFAKGEVLLKVDPVDYQVQLRIAEGAVTEAKLALAEEEARVRQAKKDWEKIGGVKNASDLALRKPQLAAAQARVQTAIAQLTQARINLERTEIKAPYAGRVLKKQVDLGSVVSPQTTLAEIYATDYVEVRLPLNNTDLGFIDLPEQRRGGEPPGVTIFNNLASTKESWRGKIVRTEGAIDATTQQLYVVAQIDDPFGLQDAERYPLKIGQYVSAEIQGRRLPEALVIPVSTIYQGSYVYVAKGDVLHRQNIEIGWQSGKSALISEGLQAGEELILTPLGQVNSGVRIKRAQNEPEKVARRNAEKTTDATAGDVQ
ncbi:Membrane-fusion protein [Hahella chejuensis KCTC 2396]|uniref:Membrane-fusion protein n=1 Tax=Hahella chejuensis (strain KCTC 2396) TaxID=349521 RepID=Q2SM01_HAHCH|nr:efflux RND transporter periplasmic adaptor subunit [Hahella chejuensis]ABC28323.1 Membrane-fusion protein [Hahella chejuensis KCTC 2396]